MILLWRRRDQIKPRAFAGFIVVVLLLSDVDFRGDRHQIPAPANQWPHPAHLLAHHRLRAVPDRDASEPPPDRRIVPGLCLGDSRRLPARGACGSAAAKRCGSQRPLQPRHLRERYARRVVLQACQAEVLRLGTLQRHLLLYPVHLPVDGGEPLALEAGGVCRPFRARPVRHAGADAIADAAPDRLPTCCSWRAAAQAGWMSGVC